MDTNPAATTAPGGEVERIWESPARVEVVDAIEALGLKEHERPKGLVGFQGHAFVHVPEKLIKLLAVNPTAEEVRAAVVLLVDSAAEAEERVEQEAKWAYYERGGAVAGVSP